MPVGVPVEVVVSVRNRAGEESGEAWASFVVGLLPENAHADWITDGTYTADDTAALYFRREFTVRHDLTTATLYCAGIGYQSVTVNGTALSDARLDPAHTDYTRLVAYTTDILTPMELSPVTNVLGIAVGMGWRGGVLPNGMIPAFFGRPMLWAILVLRYADGTVDTIATDERWQVGRGAITSATIYNGETFDCLLYTSDSADDSIRVDHGGPRIKKKPGGCRSRGCSSSISDRISPGYVAWCCRRDCARDRRSRSAMQRS